jgi:O-antigen/teichoic acid export membrane protein
MQDFYKKTNRILYFIGAFIAGFCIPWSEEILQISAGGEYIDGKTTFILMLIYPVHQCLGQINGAVLLATEKVKLQNLAGVIFIIISLLVAYYALAPEGLFIPGLNLGSQGLAWKMIIMQFFQVNIISYMIARIFKWKYDWLYQFYVLGVVILISFLIKFLLIKLLLSMYLVIILSFILYSMITAALLYVFPYLILGIKKEEFKDLISSFLIKIG